ncbi:PfkB family carbohydrate kinase [Mesorhizobium sp. M0633]|uniref:PfkB family carbohydrate kinase n=1 Tax=Mesorhizobium sp. M0633 TaxID=2956977 RepID=UPI0033382B5F
MTTTRDVQIAGTGFAVLDRIYQAGVLTAEGLGGSCANVLWSLAMLDRSVAPILRLGADEVGSHLVDAFRAAGAVTSYIYRREHQLSPVLVQYLDTERGEHSFSSICPETLTRLPKYTPIMNRQVDASSAVTRSCRVFYADRLSPAIVEAMEAAASAGGTVYFEPSEISDLALFRRALQATSILKFSSDRLDRAVLDDHMASHLYAVITRGSEGLEVVHRNRAVSCSAYHVEEVVDTCGSGDMVSVGLIDHLVSLGVGRIGLTVEAVVAGVRAGQRLAAANCRHVGARGLFTAEGARAARDALRE